MKPVPRIGLDTGARPGAGMADPRMSALRSRFRDMLQRSSAAGATSKPVDAAMLHTALTHEAMLSAVATDVYSRQSATDAHPRQPLSDTAMPAAAGDNIFPPSPPPERGAARGECSNAPDRKLHDDGEAPKVHAPERASIEPQSGRSGAGSSCQMPPSARPELPQLLRDLVQSVLDFSRGREGRWRLTAQLKPQVLGGAWLVMTAQPGSLHVRFDCAAAPARARLEAVRSDLRDRLAEALSVAQPIVVQVDVNATAQAHTHGPV